MFIVEFPVCIFAKVKKKNSKEIFHDDIRPHSESNQRTPWSLLMAANHSQSASPWHFNITSHRPLPLV